MPGSVCLIQPDDCKNKIDFTIYSFPIIGSDGRVYEYDTYVNLTSKPESSRSLLVKHPTIKKKKVDGKVVEVIEHEALVLTPVSMFCEDFMDLLQRHKTHLDNEPLDKYLTLEETPKLRDSVEIEPEDLSSRQLDEITRIDRLMYSVAFYYRWDQADANRHQCERVKSVNDKRRAEHAEKKKSAEETGGSYANKPEILREEILDINDDELYLPTTGWHALHEAIERDDVDAFKLIVDYRRNYLSMTPSNAIKEGITALPNRDKIKDKHNWERDQALACDSKRVFLKARNAGAMKILKSIVNDYHDRHLLKFFASRGDFTFLEELTRQEVCTAKDVGIAILRSYISKREGLADYTGVNRFFKWGYPVSEKITAARFMIDELSKDEVTLPLRVNKRRLEVLSSNTLGDLTLRIDRLLVSTTHSSQVAQREIEPRVSIFC